MKKLFLLINLIAVGESSAYTAWVNPFQVAALDAKEKITQLEMIKQVKNQLEMIKQFKEQIDLDTLQNKILGEYGLGDLSDIDKVLDQYADLGAISDIGDISDIIGDVSAPSNISISEIWGNTSDGAFAPVKAPIAQNKERYQAHTSFETAMKRATEVQKTVKVKNEVLGKEAVAQRKAAESATNQADYREHIDKAKAAEKAIERNASEARLASKNVELYKAAAVANERKREKAENDRAREKAREDNKAMSDAFQDFDFKLD